MLLCLFVTNLANPIHACIETIFRRLLDDTVAFIGLRKHSVVCYSQQAYCNKQEIVKSSQIIEMNNCELGDHIKLEHANLFNVQIIHEFQRLDKSNFQKKLNTRHQVWSYQVSNCYSIFNDQISLQIV